jgi:hypothetical protein
MISNAQMLPAPILLAIKHAVEGNNMSGVAVAHIKRSISSARVFVFLSNPLTAAVPRSEDPLFLSFKILLSFIPVLETIHSSLVSTSSQALYCLTHNQEHIPVFLLLQH